jgi:hypothetical protein
MKIGPPRHGAYWISAYTPDVMLEIRCALCGRTGRRRVASLLAEHGDMPLPDLSARLAGDCERPASYLGRKPCQIRFVAVRW